MSYMYAYLPSFIVSSTGDRTRSLGLGKQALLCSKYRERSNHSLVYAFKVCEIACPRFNVPRERSKRAICTLSYPVLLVSSAGDRTRNLGLGKQAHYQSNSQDRQEALKAHKGA